MPITHDDGTVTEEYSKADIILFGVSRTSKTPTSIYLANRGYFVANMPIHPCQHLDPKLWANTQALLIGLTISATRLVELRRNRCLSRTHYPKLSSYATMEEVEEELLHASKIYNQHQIGIIDITRKSIEETASIIIARYHEHHQAK